MFGLTCFRLNMCLFLLPMYVRVNVCSCTWIWLALRAHACACKVKHVCACPSLRACIYSCDKYFWTVYAVCGCVCVCVTERVCLSVGGLTCRFRCHFVRQCNRVCERLVEWFFARLPCFFRLVVSIVEICRCAC